MTEPTQTAAGKAPARWRMVTALTLIALSLSSAAFVPLVLLLPLSVELKTSISGLLVFGIPQAVMLLAVALAGKSGFAFLKGMIFARVKRLAPVQTVSRTRYRIGLVMFILPFLLAFVTPYAPQLLLGYGTHARYYGVAGDLMLILSFLVLGGDFWDKIRALFLHDARARFGA